MNTKDYITIRNNARDFLDCQTEPSLLRSGFMAVWFGIKLMISKDFGDILAIPKTPEGYFPVLKEKVI